MRLKLITAPTSEPISLQEAKNHLKVDDAEDNTLIGALIITARQLAEKETKRAFITQTWEMCLDKVAEEIEIPKPPLQSIESIKAISSIETIVDETSATTQAVLKVDETSGFSVADTVIVNRGGLREEELIILSIQDDVSLTMTTNLTKEHTDAQADRVEKYTLVSKARYNVDIPGSSPGRVRLRTGYIWPAHRGFSSFLIEFKAGYGDTSTDVLGTLKQGMLLLIGYLYKNREEEEIPKEIKARFWGDKILNI